MDYRCILIACLAFSFVEMREIVERMVMVRKTGSDLEPEATGFIYKSEDKGPARFVKLGEKEVHKHLDNMPKKYYEAPVKKVNTYKRTAGDEDEKKSEELKVEASVLEAIPVLEYPDDEYLVYDNYGPGYYSEYDGPFYGEGLGGYDGPSYGDYYGYGGGLEDGNLYDANIYSDYGEKGLAGYEEAKRFNRGDHESYGAAKEDGFVKEGAGEESAAIDEEDNFGDDYATSNSYKGGDSAHEKDFGKGVKVTGFHKVYNKDDFQKVSDVYDESDNSGKFNKHKSGEGGHASSSGGYVQGGEEAAAKDEADFAQKAFVDAGEESASDVGYNKESGSQGYNEHQKEFDVKGAAGDGRSFEYEDYRL